MSDEQKKQPTPSYRKYVLVSAVIIIGAAIGVGLADYDSTLYTQVDFIDAKNHTVWFSAIYGDDYGTWKTNHFLISVDDVECDEGHCAYVLAFSKKIDGFCKDSIIKDCNAQMKRTIEEGAFQQQAFELGLTKDDRVSADCYDNGRWAHCRNPQALESHLKELEEKEKFKPET